MRNTTIKKKTKTLKENKIKTLKKENRINLINFIKTICKNYGEGSLRLLSDVNTQFLPENIVSTGSIQLDKILSINGLPLGRIVEIYGTESSGKTTWALTILKNVQDKFKTANTLYIDTEFAVDISYCDNLKIDKTRFLFCQPNSAEKALDILIKTMASNKIKLVILDSVAALVPEAILKGSLYDKTSIAGVSRLMAKTLGIISALANKNNILVIFINQMRSNFNNNFGFFDSKTTTGGKALRYYASIRFELARESDIKSLNNKTVGINFRVKITKNKTSTPYGRVTIPLLFKTGISKEIELLNLGIKYSFIKQRGPWYVYNNNHYKGKNEILNFLSNKQNSDLLEKNILSFKE